MARTFEVVLKIEGYTPDRIPMSRLAEYMADFAKLLGGQGGVHFVSIDNASVGIRAKVEHSQSNAVRERLHSIKRDVATVEARAAFKAIDDRLREDSTFASVIRPKGGQIIQFPGVKAPPPVAFLPVEQADRISGIVVGLGGRSRKIAETQGQGIAVYVDTGRIVHICQATREMARELGQYLFEVPLELAGAATWVRALEGGWTLQKFVIHNHIVLEDSNLAEIATSLRLISSDIESGSDAAGELLRVRRGQV